MLLKTILKSIVKKVKSPASKVTICCSVYVKLDNLPWGLCEVFNPILIVGVCPAHG